MKKKKYIIIGCLVVVVLLIFYLVMSSNKKNQEQVLSNDNLLISIDGKNSSTLPTTGTYYLTSYTCDNDKTKLVWDIYSYELSVSNGRSGGDIFCNVEFKSKPTLAEMPIGSYVAYVGNGGTVGGTSVSCKKNGAASSSDSAVETEAPNSCYGQNAREDLDKTGFVYAYGYSNKAEETYGYCYNSVYKYHTTGWRIAYIEGNKPVIVSAGSPECVSDSSIQILNGYALKYCNTAYVDGNCSCNGSISNGCSSSSSDAWAINDTDFYNMTKAISGVGKRLSVNSSQLGDVGGILGEALYCYGKNSYPECGYHNDLIDNGSYYWFATSSVSLDSLLFWDGSSSKVIDYIYSSVRGLRPVISLSATVYVTGGAGTMDDPYKIAKA